jgi:hypothetical protein
VSCTDLGRADLVVSYRCGAWGVRVGYGAILRNWQLESCFAGESAR